ncbi:Endonuclease YncB, thermonuclease family [Pseudomonas linyingensis]|uniref:Endonuclease YncB, thermonuclease family n=1 Tax=Pseudomonas linyingensis TaxID=915471 RepID=A0A1H6TYG8_9PSED|nr:thermonuclease family protein [Pseudomonas linyingensis]SEI80772.1 Endonuclease YncB, thermonuclease family [Pseudomonas linyingensis]
MQSLFPGTAKKASLWGAFFVCAVVVLTPLRALADACRAPGPLRETQVARVVDGDTLRLADGRSVRLIGVNAPEKARAGQSAEPFAEVATHHLEQLVAASGGQVGLVAGEQARDHYGRSLAHAFGRDGHSWEAQQLAAGLGFAVAIAPNTALVDCLWTAEHQARLARKGVWRRNPVLEVGQLRRAGFAVLRGRVAALERNRGGVWLQLDGPLVLRIELQRLVQFDEGELRRLAGREVEVRGWVVDRSRRGALRPGQARWLLTLSHPSMLEVR